MNQKLEDLNAVNIDQMQLDSTVSTKPKIVVSTSFKTLVPDNVVPQSIRLLNENWKRYPGGFNYYVSDFGRVWSLTTRQILSSNPCKTGYILYYLRCGGETLKISGHQLVMHVFDKIKPEGYVIDHIDGNRTNNKLSNLRYVTVAVNNLNKVNNGPRGKEVNQYDLDGTLIKVWKNASVAAAAFKTQRNKMSYYCLNKTIAFNSKWEYAEELLEGEEWKVVPLKKGKLQVSNLGRVRSGVYNANYGVADAAGYKKVCAGGKTFRVCRLVCEAFKGPPPFPKAVVNHIDENITNDKAKNLEWLTTQENTEYSCAKAVAQYKPDGTFVAEFKSIVKAAEATGFHTTYIGQSCRGVPKTGEFVFRYSDDTFESTKKHISIKKGKEVVQCNLEGEEIARYNSLIDTCRKLANVTMTPLVEAIKNKTEYCGYLWEFLERV